MHLYGRIRARLVVIPRLPLVREDRAPVVNAHKCGAYSKKGEENV